MKRKITVLFIAIILFMIFLTGSVYAMQIFIKLPSGNYISLEAEPTSTISSIKIMIEDRESIAPVNQTLTFASSTLEDENTLQDYNIQKDSTIHLSATNNIIYNSFGGTIEGVYPTTYSSSSTVFLPVNVTKEGYFFVNWFNKPLSEEGKRTSIEFIQPDTIGNVNLYAFYTKINNIVDAIEEQNTNIEQYTDSFYIGSTEIENPGDNIYLDADYKVSNENDYVYKIIGKKVELIQVGQPDKVYNGTQNIVLSTETVNDLLNNTEVTTNHLKEIKYYTITTQINRKTTYRIENRNKVQLAMLDEPKNPSKEDDFLFKSEGEYEDFMDVYVDNKLLIEDIDYKVSEGSIIIKLLQNFLNGLNPGQTYTLNIVTTKGIASSQFIIPKIEKFNNPKIVKSNNPNTGDNVITVTSIALIVLTATLIIVKKAQKGKK